MQLIRVIQYSNEVATNTLVQSTNAGANGAIGATDHLPVSRCWWDGPRLRGWRPLMPGLRND